MTTNSNAIRPKFYLQSAIVRSLNVLVILATLIGLTSPALVQKATRPPVQGVSPSLIHTSSSLNHVQTANFLASTKAALYTIPGSHDGVLPFFNSLLGGGLAGGGSHDLPPGTHVYTSDPGNCNNPNPSATEMSMPYETMVFGPFNLGDLGPDVTFWVCAGEGDFYFNLKAEALGSDNDALIGTVKWRKDLQGNDIPSERRMIIQPPVETIWQHQCLGPLDSHRVVKAEQNLHLEGGKYEINLMAWHLFTWCSEGQEPFSLLKFDIDFPRMPDEGTWSKECNCIVKNPDPFALDPVNTRTGNYTHQETDISIPTRSQPLEFERSYNSQDLHSSIMGRGWTDNYNMHIDLIVFGSQEYEYCTEYLCESLGGVLLSGAVTDIVVVAPHGSRLHFMVTSYGGYVSSPGIGARLEGPGNNLRLITEDNVIYNFNQFGRLASIEDSHGNTTTFSYDYWYSLNKVTAPDGRSLSFTYDYDPARLIQVTDPLSRTMTYSYTFNTIGQPLLDGVTDPSGKVIRRYSYDPDGNLATIKDALGRTLVSNVYDQKGNRLISQSVGLNDANTLGYDVLNQQTTITNTNGSHTIYANDYRLQQHAIVDDQGNVTFSELDNHYNLVSFTDPLGRTTNYTWNASDDPTSITDPLENTTSVTYDENNNPSGITDPFLHTTHFLYNNQNDLLIITDTLDSPTVFTYNDYGQVTTRLDPRGVTTHYFYDTYGNQIGMSNSIGTPYPNYSYDILSRLQKVVYPTGQVNWTCYDTAGRVNRTVANATGDGSSPQTNPCDAANYQPSSDHNYDIVSTTNYDDAGEVIATIDPDGLITRSYYDDGARVYAVVNNLSGQTIDSPTPPAYNPADPDHNIRNEIVYDTLGRVIATIDTLSHVTRTYYDELGRAYYVINNLVIRDTGGNPIPNDQAITQSTPPSYNPNYPDENVGTQTIYDASGSVIATIDPLGHITRTYYDRAGRPFSVVDNLVIRDSNGNPLAIEQLLAIQEPPLPNNDYPDENLRNDTVYDASGNTIASIDPIGRVARTWYDDLGRAVTTVQNLTGQDIWSETPPDRNTSTSDENLRTDTIYDAEGRQIATIDPEDIVTRTYYDGRERVSVIVRNLIGQSSQDPTPPVYNPSYPDRNVRTETLYDDDNRVIGSVDALGHITRTYFDGFERPYLVVRNLTGQLPESPVPPSYDPEYPDRNVQTRTVYDTRDRTVATIDPLGYITRSYYDGLGRTQYVVRNLVIRDENDDPIPAEQAIAQEAPPTYNSNHPDENIRTQTIYGPGGRAIETVDADGLVTHTCTDGLDRTVKTVVNPSVSDPCGSYTPSTETDHDITTSTTYTVTSQVINRTDANGLTTTFIYDGAGRLSRQVDPLVYYSTSYTYDLLGSRITMTDPRGIVTLYEYDDTGRTTAVVENFHPEYGPSNEMNVRTEYTYDIAGNRRTILDALSHTTNFDYDDLGRLKAETDPLEHSTTYIYDAAGKLASKTDANGSTINYIYDDLGRLITIDYPNPEPDVSYTYRC